MPSPLPGMNPDLEHPNVWTDFHETLIPAIRTALMHQIRPKYFVQIDEEVYIEDWDEQRLVGRPDVSVGRISTDSGPMIATATVAEPPARASYPP